MVEGHKIDIVFYLIRRKEFQSKMSFVLLVDKEILYLNLAFMIWHLRIFIWIPPKQKKKSHIKLKLIIYSIFQFFRNNKFDSTW